MKSEFDYRKNPEGKFIMPGYSAYEGIPEMNNKDQLLLLSVGALFEKRYVYKSNGILIYKVSDNALLKDFNSKDIIIELKKAGDCVDVCLWNGWNNPFCEDQIMKMVKYYNAGYQRTLPLRIVK